MSLQRLKLLIAYRGTRYFGWKTTRREDELPTVQGVLKKVIEPIVGHPIQLVGSSRTDSGVHAKGQVAHFDTERTQIPPDGLLRAINHQLPPDIVIRKVEPVDESFHAILSTTSKRYQYILWRSPYQPVFREGLVWWRDRRHDIDRMREAAQEIVGTHDFTSFCKTGHTRLTTVRTVYECSISVQGPRIVIGVEGSGFLWNMVRIIVGTLSEVGMGRFSAADVKRILQSRDRTLGGITAPPDGLYLQWIKFGNDKVQIPSDQLEVAETDELE